MDIHTHFVPRWFAEDAESTKLWEVTVEDRDGESWFVHDQGYGYPVPPEFFCGPEKLDDMTRRSIDASVLSVTPTLFNYWIKDADAARFCRMANDDLAEIVSTQPSTYSGLATLPMQSPEAAAGELYRSVKELGLVGAEIGTSIEEHQLDDLRFEPFWEAANELGVPIMLHPYYVGPKAGFEPYYLTNSFGNPLDTAIAAARLMMSGTLDRYPNVRLVLVHGGGFMPYQLGRLDHAWGVRPEPKVATARPPSAYLEQFYFDTITHNDHALKWLVEFAGADHVALGSDLPFDMADEAPADRVNRAVPDEARHHVLGGTARSLFQLEPEIEDSARAGS